MGEAKNPGPQNPEQQDQGDSQLPDSKRLKTGPEFHITVHFAPNGETGHLRRTTLRPRDTTDRVRYRWQALAPGKARCASRDLTSPADALQSWYEKYHSTLTDESRRELQLDIRRRTDAEARGTHESNPNQPSILNNYAEGGSSGSGTDCRGNPNVLQLLCHAAGENDRPDASTDHQPTHQTPTPENAAPRHEHTFHVTADLQAQTPELDLTLERHTPEATRVPKPWMHSLGKLDDIEPKRWAEQRVKPIRNVPNEFQAQYREILSDLLGDHAEAVRQSDLVNQRHLEKVLILPKILLHSPPERSGIPGENPFHGQGPPCQAPAR